MAEQHILIMPVVKQAEAALVQHAQPRLATPEEIRAADQVFASQEKEQELVSGLVGMYTGAILLRDLAAEHLTHEDLEEAHQKEDEDAE